MMMATFLLVVIIAFRSSHQMGSLITVGKEGQNPPEFNEPVGVAAIRPLNTEVYIPDCNNQILNPTLETISVALDNHPTLGCGF